MREGGSEGGRKRGIESAENEGHNDEKRERETGG
jgi:hypothetical protein